MKKSAVKRSATIAEQECVACGCCVKVCPLKAINIEKGIFARVDKNKCVGCGKCEKICPASLIKIDIKEEIKC